MFLQLNESRINLLAAFEVTPYENEIVLSYQGEVSVGAPEDSTWGCEYPTDSVTQFTVYPSHPKYQALLAWVNANTL